MRGTVARPVERREPAAFKKAVPGAPQFFNPEIFSEREAGVMWHRCIRAIDRCDANHTVPTLTRAGNLHSELHSLHCERGHLVRFWLRLVHDNTLVIVGNRQGLLPLDVEALHG